jgi:hypothetical protein
MAMPRPTGKAKRIADKVVPGLARTKSKPRKKRKEAPNDEVEMKIVSINENLGRSPTPDKLFGI